MTDPAPIRTGNLNLYGDTYVFVYDASFRDEEQPVMQPMIVAQLGANMTSVVCPAVVCNKQVTCAISE